jgi:hypothetical protein
MIHIQRTKSGDPMQFLVTVSEGGGQTRHEVTMAKATHAKLGGGKSPEELLRAAFVFLLEREPKESILTRFDLPVIGRYFPEYEREIRRRVGGR